MGPNEQNQHFAEFRQIVHTFINTQLSAPKMFAKFGCQTQTICNKKEEKTVTQAWVRQAIVAPPVSLCLTKLTPPPLSQILDLP